MSSARLREQRGSTLVFSMILLGVLSAIGVAAVALSTQERANAASYSQYDALVACANAAQAKLWADVGAQGPAYLSTTPMTVTSITLPDGRDLLAPAHFGATSGLPQTLSGLGGAAAGTSAGTGGSTGAVTNTIIAPMSDGAGGGGGAGGTWATARCRDSGGNEHEVEFAFRYAL